MIKKLTKALKKDDGLYYAYQANIAMAFSDTYYQYKKKHNKEYLNRDDIHNISNKAAKYFLELLIQRKKLK